MEYVRFERIISETSLNLISLFLQQHQHVSCGREANFDAIDLRDSCADLRAVFLRSLARRDEKALFNFRRDSK